jgi:hypothetical protein
MNDKTQIKSKNSLAECPSCEKYIQLRPTAAVGDIIKCKRCYADLEILEFNPVVLDWASYESDRPEYSEYGD